MLCSFVSNLGHLFYICSCFWTNLYLIKFVTMFVYGLCVCMAILKMPYRSSHGKEPLIDLTSSPISKRTYQSLGNFDKKRFKTLFDSQSFNNNFKNALIVLERIVRFNTLG